MNKNTEVHLGYDACKRMNNTAVCNGRLDVLSVRRIML